MFKLAIKTFIVNFEDISDLVLVFLLFSNILDHNTLL